MSVRQLPVFFGVRDVSPALDAASRTHQHSLPIQSGADTPHSKESSHVDSRSRSFGRCRVVVLSLVWFGVASVSASFRNSSLRMLTDDGYVPVCLGLT